MAQSAEGDQYRFRADLEREIADRSSDPDLKRIHENMARMYDALSQSYGPVLPRVTHGGGPSGPPKRDGEGAPLEH